MNTINYYIVSPFSNKNNGITNYCNHLYSFLKNKGLNVILINNDNNLKKNEFENYILDIVKDNLSIVEVPDVWGFFSHKKYNFKLHVRLHGSFEYISKTNGNKLNKSRIKNEYLTILKADFISSPSHDNLLHYDFNFKNKNVNIYPNPYFMNIENYKNTNKDIDLLIIGRNEKIKGIEAIEKVCLSLHKNINIFTMGIENNETLQQLNITNLNWVSNEDKNKYLSRSKKVLVLSFFESFSMVVLEALYFNCNVICWKLPSFEENFISSNIKLVSLNDFDTLFKELKKNYILEENHSFIEKNNQSFYEKFLISFNKEKSNIFKKIINKFKSKVLNFFFSISLSSKNTFMIFKTYNLIKFLFNNNLYNISFIKLTHKYYKFIWRSKGINKELIQFYKNDINLKKLSPKEKIEAAAILIQSGNYSKAGELAFETLNTHHQIFKNNQYLYLINYLLNNYNLKDILNENDYNFLIKSQNIYLNIIKNVKKFENYVLNNKFYIIGNKEENINFTIDENTKIVKFNNFNTNSNLNIWVKSPSFEEVKLINSISNLDFVIITGIDLIYKSPNAFDFSYYFFENNIPFLGTPSIVYEDIFNTVGFPPSSGIQIIKYFNSICPSSINKILGFSLLKDDIIKTNKTKKQYKHHWLNESLYIKNILKDKS